LHQAFQKEENFEEILTRETPKTDITVIEISECDNNNNKPRILVQEEGK
jgi:hypothetical protein